MFIRYRFFGYLISALLVAGSITALSVWGLKLGIDFTGGSLLDVEFPRARPSSDELRARIADLDLGNVIAQPVGERGYLLRFRDVDEPTHQAILRNIGTSDEVIENRFESIGPVIGVELKRRAMLAMALVIVAILVYIAWAFRRASHPVASWKYGVAAILALAHDVTIPTGIFAALGKFQGVEIDIAFVTALLTILGFSVHDTIVVFDRVRENLKRAAGTFSDIVEASIRQTIARSINTSLTVALVLLAVILFGGASVRYFSLALLLGIAFGTYSSIFIASPLLVDWEKRLRRKS